MKLLSLIFFLFSLHVAAQNKIYAAKDYGIDINLSDDWIVGEEHNNYNNSLDIYHLALYLNDSSVYNHGHALLDIKYSYDPSGFFINGRCQYCNFQNVGQGYNILKRDTIQFCSLNATRIEIDVSVEQEDGIIEVERQKGIELFIPISTNKYYLIRALYYHAKASEMKKLEQRVLDIINKIKLNPID